MCKEVISANYKLQHNLLLHSWVMLVRQKKLEFTALRELPIVQSESVAFSDKIFDLHRIYHVIPKIHCLLIHQNYFLATRIL